MDDRGKSVIDSETIKDSTSSVDAPCEIDLESSGVSPEKRKTNPTQSNVAKPSKRFRSKWWEHYKKVEGKNKNGDPIINAICNYCGKNIEVNTTKVGTNPISRHIEKDCTKYMVEKRKSQVKGQQQLVFGEKKVDGSCSIESFVFNQERSRRDFCEAIILHEYPFNIVNHVALRKWVRNMCPEFKFVSRTTIARECHKIYDELKKETFDTLEKVESRISLTSDIWTSCQTISYIVMTAHYIDKDWRLQSRTLSFCEIDSHTGHEISKHLYEKCVEWNIERKLFSVALDNCSANDVAIRELRDDLLYKGYLVFDGGLFHVRCTTHILNLIVQYGLSLIGEVVAKIRQSVKYVNSSPQRLKNFYKHADQLKVPKKKLVNDVVTRWNSTHLMLNVALEFKDVFVRMKSLDHNYVFLPSNEEWENMRVVNESLRVFYELTELFSGTKYPTSNLFFGRICELKLKLKEWCHDSNKFKSSMAFKMVEKYGKYWDDLLMVLALATIFDPRYKMQVIECYYMELYGEIVGQMKVDEVRKALKKLFDEYASLSSSSDFDNMIASSQAITSEKQAINSGGCGDAFAKRFNKYMGNNLTSQKTKMEYELYLEEPLICELGGNTFNALIWWKKYTPKYPILSRIARDVLAIPISTVASESAFSTGGRTISPSRSSLSTETVKRLICSQSWLRAKVDCDNEVVDSSIFDYETILQGEEELIVEE